jgi:signal transduction histidine kinase
MTEAHLKPHRPLSTTAATCIVVVGVGVATLATHNISVNFHRHNPTLRWSWVETIVFPLGVVSSVAAVAAGVALIRLTNRLAIGLRFVGIGYAFAAWLAANYWPSRWSPFVSLLLVLAFRPLLFTAVLAWPTGSLPPRWRKRVTIVFVGLTLLSLLMSVTRMHIGPDTVWGWTSWPMPQVGSVAFGQVVRALGTVITLPALAVAVIVVILHRRHRLPTTARSLTNVAVVAGFVAVCADLWMLLTGVVFQALAYNGHQRTVVGAIALITDYGRWGAVPVLFLIEALSQKRIEPGTTSVDVELNDDDASAVGLATMIADSTGDPSVRVLWPVGDRWIDEVGRTVNVGDPDRRCRIITDTTGRAVVAVETTAATEVPVSLLDAAAGDTLLAADRSQQRVAAIARLSELRAAQRALIDAQDRARQRIERDLHDGAQQQLVGLALQARLAARHQRADRAQHEAGSSLRGDLAAAVREVAGELVHLVSKNGPAVLDHGLGPALASLAAGCPVPVQLELRGNLDQSPVQATQLWYATCDALANSLKHGDPEAVTIQVVGTEQVLIASIVDDGRGGLATVPDSLARRILPTGGVVTVGAGNASVRGTGTTVRIELPTAPHQIVEAQQ